MMLTTNICDDKTPTALKFETSQLESRNYVIIFNVPANQFMPNCLRQQLSSPAKLQLIIYY